MVVTYYINFFRTEADKHNRILMSLLLRVAETKVMKSYRAIIKIGKNAGDLAKKKHIYLTYSDVFFFAANKLININFLFPTLRGQFYYVCFMYVIYL